MFRKVQTAYLGLGSNLGDRAALLAAALRSLDALPGIAVGAVSSFIETKPVGNTEQPDFLNCVAMVGTTLSPEKLLEACNSVEAALGRTREVHWGPRTVDIDILLFDALQIHTPKLTIPHPLMHERAFVLIPLAEIAPDALHPVLGKTARELAEALP